MSSLRARFFPALTTTEQERRLRLFRILLILQVVATIPLAVISVLDSGAFLILLLCLLMVLLAIFGYWLARRGRLHLGATLLILTQLAFVGFFVAFYGTRGPIPFFFIWPIIAAAILMEPPAAFVTTTLAALLYGAMAFLELYQVWRLPLFQPDFFAFWHRPDDSNTVQRFITDTIDVVIVYYGTAFLIWVVSQSLHRALLNSQDQTAELERYRTELEKNLNDLGRTTERLQDSLFVIQEIGNPVLPILEGVILTPLIGALDSERVGLVMQQVLQGAAEHRARVVILDITGVPVVDTAVANALIQTARGVRLLGATPVLVGIRSEVAQTIVDLGVDLRGIVTRSSLQDGLAYALEEMGT